MRIRDGDSSDPGWIKVRSGIRYKHPGSATVVSKLSEIWSGIFILDLDFYPSRIRDLGVKKAPDSDPQHWSLQNAPDLEYLLLLLTSSDVQVVKCSACVVRDWGKETPAHDVLQVGYQFSSYFKSENIPRFHWNGWPFSDSSEASISRDIFSLKGNEMDFKNFDKFTELDPS